MTTPDWAALPIPADLELNHAVTATGHQLAWITPLTPDRIAELLQTLVPLFGQTGWWPVATTAQTIEVLADPDHNDEVAPLSEVDRVDVAALLQELADQDETELLDDPDATWQDYDGPPPAQLVYRGLAPGQPHGPVVLDPETLSLPVEADALALVQVDRPADVLAAIGWHVPNTDLTGTQGSALLRSWEDRFGAVVTGATFDQLTVQSPAVPLTADRAALLTGEFYALDSDVISSSGADWGWWLEHTQNDPGWFFWWD